MDFSVIMFIIACQSEGEIGSAGEQPTSNKADDVNGKRQFFGAAFIITYRNVLMASKNSFVVRQIHIPFDKVNAVLQGQSSVQIQVIFQMREEAFNAISGGRDLWIGEVMEHVR